MKRAKGKLEGLIYSMALMVFYLAATDPSFGQFIDHYAAIYGWVTDTAGQPVNDTLIEASCFGFSPTPLHRTYTGAGLLGGDPEGAYNLPVIANNPSDSTTCTLTVRRWGSSSSSVYTVPVTRRESTRFDIVLPD